MGVPSPEGHHRRRSSVRTPTIPQEEETDDLPQPESPHTNDQNKNEQEYPIEDTESLSDLSSLAESVDMDYRSSDDDLRDDEETGLTTKQRRQRRRRRRQRRQLDARIAGVKASRQDGGPFSLADRNVAKRLLVNAVLIGSWYFFSLAISIVSRACAASTQNELFNKLTWWKSSGSTTSGCSLTPGMLRVLSFFLSPYSQPAYTWLSSSHFQLSSSMPFPLFALRVLSRPLWTTILRLSSRRSSLNSSI